MTKQRGCSICGVPGHYARNKLFHPKENAGAPQRRSTVIPVARVASAGSISVRTDSPIAIVVPSSKVPPIVNAAQHELDLAVPCMHKKCYSAAGVPCKGLDPGIVHFSRRLRRLLVARGFAA